jgi:limonene-1,2-epoxide hydrolase
MTQNARLVHAFYTAFQNKDYQTMQASYVGDAMFSDPVFSSLNAAELRGMWEMFCKKGEFISLEFRNVKADDYKGSAEWIATYVFSKTGRTVTNHIYASFIFENNKIKQHTDRFDFYKWARQAFGFTGIMLGWTSFFHNQVRDAAMKNLYAFIRTKA